MGLKRFDYNIKDNRKKRSIIAVAVIVVALIVGVTFYATYASYKVTDSYNVIQGKVGNFSGTLCTATTADTKTTGNVPAGSYTAGDEYICTLGGEDYHFFVLGENSSNSNKVDLIMNQNIGSTVAWITEEDYIAAGGTVENWNMDTRNIYGPITANVYLASQTSTWEVTPTLPTIAQINGAFQEIMPTWLYDYLDEATHPVSDFYGYWISSPSDYNFDSTFVVMSELGGGYVNEFGVSGGSIGVRPVITIAKSKLS